MAVTASERTGSDMRNAIRFASHAGVASIAFGIGGYIVDQMWTFPGSGATATQIASFVGAHRSALLLAMVLNTTAVALWLLFGVGVWLRLREMASGESFLSTCFLVGFVSFVMLLLAGFTCLYLLAYRAPESSDPRLLYDLAWGLLAMSGVPTALALGAYAVQVFRDRRLPGWTAWLAAVAALAHLALIASFVVRTGFFSLEGWVTTAIPATLFAWIMGTSIAMMGAVRSEPSSRR
jgi:hypothetical protein